MRKHLRWNGLHLGMKRSHLTSVVESSHGVYVIHLDERQQPRNETTTTRIPPQVAHSNFQTKVQADRINLLPGVRSP